MFLHSVFIAFLFHLDHICIKFAFKFHFTNIKCVSKLKFLTKVNNLTKIEHLTNITKIKYLTKLKHLSKKKKSNKIKHLTKIKYLAKIKYPTKIKHVIKFKDFIKFKHIALQLKSSRFALPHFLTLDKSIAKCFIPFMATQRIVWSTYSTPF